MRLPKLLSYAFFATFFLLASCDSLFNFEEEGIIEQEEERFEEDEDGDPVIVNPSNDPERSLGLDNSYCYGFSLPDEPVAVIELPETYPEAYDLSKYLPPVGSQGEQGSCVAWASGYYLKGFQENYQDSQAGDFTLTNLFSPAYVFNQIKVSDCSGSQIADALELIKNTGIPDWNVMPYDPSQCDEQPTDFVFGIAEENRIESYAYLDAETLFEQAKAFLLADRPIVIAIAIDRAYFGAREEGQAIYRKFKNVDGAHAMLVVGYDDNMNAFKVVNSWGSDWGNRGFVWIDYKAFQEVLVEDSDFKILCEAWVAEDLAL